MTPCQKCRHWGDGDGKSCSSPDAGSLNFCNHPGIAGDQHPSWTHTKIVIDAGAKQRMMTRYNFGCILGETVFDILEKKHV